MRFPIPAFSPSRADETFATFLAALLESQQPAEYHVATRPNFPQPPGNFSSFHFDEVGPTPAAIARRLSAPIGEESIDARLSRPQMERSLSQHLCEGESICCLKRGEKTDGITCSIS